MVIPSIQSLFIVGAAIVVILISALITQKYSYSLRTKRVLTHVNSIANVWIEDPLEIYDAIPKRYIRKWNSSFEIAIIRLADSDDPKIIEGLQNLALNTRIATKYIKKQRSIIRARRTIAAEALVKVGNPDLVDRMVKTLKRKDWSVEAYLLSTAVVRWSRDERFIRTVWILMLRFEKLSPRVIAEMLSASEIDFSSTIHEFLADETAVLSALELLALRRDFAIETVVDWHFVFQNSDVDVVCAAIRLYMNTHRSMPPYMNTWWMKPQARITFASEARSCSEISVVCYLEQCRKDDVWWVRLRANESLEILQRHGLNRTQ